MSTLCIPIDEYTKDGYRHRVYRPLNVPLFVRGDEEQRGGKGDIEELRVQWTDDVILYELTNSYCLESARQMKHLTID